MIPLATVVGLGMRAGEAGAGRVQGSALGYWCRSTLLTSIRSHPEDEEKRTHSFCSYYLLLLLLLLVLVVFHL